MDRASFRKVFPGSQKIDDELLDEIIEDARYAPYVARQDAEIRDLKASGALQIPDGLSYASIPGLSNEMVERLTASRPATLADAGRVRGITPAALAALMVHSKRSLAA
jgi:tRNA uridine 5-carboxymethylaminomethyl modification enzyme